MFKSNENPIGKEIKLTCGEDIETYFIVGVYKSQVTALESMLNDYKNGININAVNKIPYYNYYMYLPVRSKTNITSDNNSG